MIAPAWIVKETERRIKVMNKVPRALFFFILTAFAALFFLIKRLARRAKVTGFARKRPETLETPGSVGGRDRPPDVIAGSG